MKTLATLLMSSCLTLAATSALAMDEKKDGMMKHDGMMSMQQCKDHMAMAKKDGMKKDDAMMKKDTMCADMMKKDGMMMKKDDAMMKSDGMMKGDGMAASAPMKK